MARDVLAPSMPPTVPRSVGSLDLSTKARNGISALDRFRTSGATKVAFPRNPHLVEAITLNTSGGLTGGDRFEARATAGAQSHLLLTTQAAERVYRSGSGAARVRTHLAAAEKARLHWLPQELIFFDGGHLDRRLEVDLAPTAELVSVEALVFGRRAMGEDQVSGHLQDRIVIRRDGAPLYCDCIRLTGDMTATLDRPGVARGAAALASVVYAGPRAEALLSALPPRLPATAGVSSPAPGLLTLRLLAPDSFDLRRTLLPLLELLTDRPLPKSWSL